MDQKRKDFRRTRNAGGAMIFRVLAILMVLYWLGGIVAAYIKGGPDAPSLGILITAVIVMGGGAVLVAVLTWKVWKQDQANAEMTEEEIARMEALREADQDE